MSANIHTEGLTKEAMTAAPGATSRYLAYIKKLNMPRAAAIVESFSRQYKTAGESEKVASETTPQEAIKLDEAVVNHVVSKIQEGTSTEDILKVIGTVGEQVDKMASEVEDPNSEDFIKKVIEAIDNGKLFEEASE